MVTAHAFCVEKFPVPCYAYIPLRAARRAFERAEFDRCCEKILKCCRLFIVASCDHERCLPQGHLKRSTHQLLDAINAAGSCLNGSYEVLSDILYNASNFGLDHKVKVSHLDLSIRLIDSLLKGTSGISFPTRIGGVL